MLAKPAAVDLTVALALVMLGCEPRAPSTAPATTRPRPPPAPVNAGTAPRATSADAGGRAAPSEPPPLIAPRPIALHMIASTRTPARVYSESTTTRLLTGSCIAEARDVGVVVGNYPLSGKSCREPLQQLARVDGRDLLQAGPEIWVRPGSGPWQLESTLSHVDHVLLSTGSALDAPILVVPFRQNGRSDYQASYSFELRRLATHAGAKIPVRAIAKANPSLPFDDFMSECFTKTRLAAPKALHFANDGRLQVFGTECSRDDQSLSSVVETWKPGETSSTLERLPFAQQDRLVQVQVDGDRSMWAAQQVQLLHFDGVTWSQVALPEGVPAFVTFSVSASGTLWLLAADGLWERKPGLSWEARTSSMGLSAVRSMTADGEDDLWLSTDGALLTTRALPSSQLCREQCTDFWHENLRMSSVPHGD